MKEFWKKWQRYGKVTGSITLENTSLEERRVIGGIVGTYFSEETIKISFSKFEQGLQKTRFAPIDMKLVLQHYFGISLYTNREQKMQVQIEKEAFLDMIFCEFKKNVPKTSVLLSWLQELKKDKKYGYSIIMKEFMKNANEAELLVQNVGKAVQQLEENEGEETPLAVFAAEVSGNPHYFDRGTVAIQLLLYAVCYWKNIKMPQSAYEWRECMQAVGLVSDNIASMVHIYGVQIETIDGIHPAYEAFCKRKEPCILTMENLKSVVRAKAIGNKVYVVENEMVFLYLIENIKEKDITLLCTSGQLRVAAFRILTLLIESGAHIYYSGDLDPEGMNIADRLWQRYGDVIHLWRMNLEDYETSISNETLNERRIAKLERLKNPILCCTAECVQKERKAGYQENLLENLLGDIVQN